MNTFKKIVIGSFIPFTISLSSCAGIRYKTITKFIEVTSKEFGDINLGLTNTEFQQRGFSYGDLISVTIKDYNGDGKDYSFAPMPYVTNYNEAGYFAACLCNYENAKKYVEFAPGMHESSLRIEEFLNKDVIVDMYQKGGYKKTLDLINCTNKLSYEELGKDNEAFGNCRDVVSVGTIREHIKPKLLYRGSSPFNPSSNPNGRHLTVDNFMKDQSIENEVSLANSLDSIRKYMTNPKVKGVCEYTTNLFNNHLYDSTKAMTDNDRFMYVSLGGNYFNINDEKTGGGDKMRLVFEMIADKCALPSEYGHSFLIHCNEGKDRTGFVLMVIEALCGVQLDDIVSDFMLTFKNYYNISIVNSEDRYNAIAEIVPYRHIYSILIDDPATELGKIDWINFNCKEAVKNIIGKSTTILQEKAYHYLTKVLKMSEDRAKAIYNNFVK